jgi:hypothetical protein
MPVEVFLSVGRTTSPEQEQFVKAVEGCLLAHDVRPVALGRNEWSSEQPLRAIRKRMEACSGSVIIAFERTHITDGTDRGRTESEGSLRDRGLPTVWNQIEAAMAHTLGHPLLVIVEKGLISEGLLEAKYDWMVQWLALEPAQLETKECLGIIGDWKRQVLERHEQRRTREEPQARDLTGKTIGEIVGELRPGQFRALVVGTIGALTAIAGTAFSVGVRVG